MLVYQRVHSLKKKGEKKGVNWGRKLLQSEAVNPRNPKWGRVGWHGAHQNQVSEFECHPPLDPQYDDHVQIGSPGNQNFCKWSHLEIHISGRVAGPNRNHGPFQELLVVGQCLPWIFNGCTAKRTRFVQIWFVAQHTNKSHPPALSTWFQVNDLHLCLTLTFVKGLMGAHVAVDPHLNRQGWHKWMLFETTRKRLQKVRSALLVRVLRLIWRKQFVGNSPDTYMGDAPVTFGINLLFVVAVKMTLDWTLDMGTKEL